MNPGSLSGMSRDAWKAYNVNIFTASDGAPTQPTVGIGSGSSGRFGRYLIIENTLVVVEIQITMNFLSATYGTGDAYVFDLPFPAKRWTGGGLISSVPLGLGMAYRFLQDPAVNMPITVTLANPFTSLAGDEDKYVQCYCQYLLSWGTGALNNGTTTITHGLGYTPRAEDVEIVPTDATTVGASTGLMQVVNCTATTFDVNINSSTADPGFSWRVRGKPPSGVGGLLSPTTPWNWSSSSFNAMFLQFSYERRG